MLRLKSIISSILIFQLGFGSLFLSRAWAQSKDEPTSSTEQNEIPDLHLPTLITPQLKAVLNEYETANTDLMPPESPDVFYLKEQYLIKKGKSYHLSDPQININAPRADFDHVEVVSDPDQSTLSFVYHKNGNEIARHTISGIQAVHVVSDQEMVQFITADRKLYAIDMLNVRKLIFEAPIPVYQVADLDSSIPDLNKVSVSLLTRGVRPPDELAANAFLPLSMSDDESIYSAGDLMIYTDDPSSGKRILNAIYSRTVTFHQVAEENTLLSLLASLALPQDKKTDVYLQNQNQPGSTADPQMEILSAASSLDQEKVNQALTSMDALSRNALVSIVSSHPTQPVSFLSNRLANQINASKPKDIFKEKEWNDYYQTLLSKAEIDPSKSTDENNEIIRKQWQAAAEKFLHTSKVKNLKLNEFINTYSLKMIAIILGGGAAISTVTAEGIDGKFGAWAVHMVSSLMNAGILPPVLRDASYRYPTLLIATTALVLFAPILIAIGGAYGYFFQKKMGALRGFSTMGIRIAALGQLPFIENMVNATKRLKKFSQKYVLNQIKRIAGVNAQDIKDPLTLHEEQVNHIRIKSYSWFLSHLVVAEKYGVDLTTLLMEENSANELANAIRNSDLNQNPEFIKHWDLVNQDILLSLSDLYHDQKLQDLDSINQEDLERDLALAKNSADLLVSDAKGKNIKNLRILKNRFIDSSNKTFNYLSTFGSGEYKLFRTVDVNQDLAKDVYQQYTADYIFSAVLQSLWGERANLANPGHLAAMRDGPLMINPTHLSDESEQNFLYTVGLSSNMVQVYQQATSLNDTTFAPIENISLKPAVREEPFLTSLKRWGLGLADLKASNYGGIALKTFWTRVSSAQMGFIFSFFLRVKIAGKSPGDAALGYVYSLLFGFFAYRYFWVFVNRGNAVLRNGIDANKALYDRAMLKLNQGLRLDDSTLAHQGYDEVMELYDRAYRDGTNQELTEMVRKVEKFMKLPKEERIQFGNTLTPYFSVLIELKSAHDSKDKSAEQEAYQKLKAIYLHTPDETVVQKLSGVELRNYAVNHPPLYNQYNHFMSHMATIFAGVIPSTICASGLFATSYDPITPMSFLTKLAVTAGSFTALYYAQKFINPYKEGVVKDIHDALQTTVKPLVDAGVKLQLEMEAVCNKVLNFRKI